MIITRFPILIDGKQVGWLRAKNPAPLPHGTELAFESMDGHTSGLFHLPTHAKPWDERFELLPHCLQSQRCLDEKGIKATGLNEEQHTALMKTIKHMLEFPVREKALDDSVKSVKYYTQYTDLDGGK